MNISLIWKFGAVGASIGTVIAEITVTAVQVYFVRHDFNFIEILKDARKYIISSIIMFAGCLIMGMILPGNVLGLGVQVCVGIVIYGVSLIILKDDFVLSMIKRLKDKVRGF